MLYAFFIILFRMKLRKYLFSLLFLLPVLLCAQNPARLSPRSITRFTESKPAPGERSALLACPYAEPQIVDPALLDELRHATIIRIDLLYTRFRRSEDFDQLALNTQRWNNLDKLLPGLLGNGLIYFQNTEQTGATDLETAETYFHGFCIYYRIPVDEKTRLEEIRMVAGYIGASDSSLTAGSPGKRVRNMTAYDSDPLEHYDTPPHFGDNDCALARYLNRNIEYPREAIARNITGVSEVSFVVNRSGGIQNFKIKRALGHGCEEAIKEALEYMPVWQPAIYKGRKVNVYQELRVRFSHGLPLEPDEIRNCDEINVRSIAVKDDEWKLTEKHKIVSKTLNNQQNLQHAALALDVTGSMGPYIADMLQYIKNNTHKIDLYAFFNDGDNKPDLQKTIGSSGGIYTYHGNVYDSIEARALQAMRNGYGGDLPENDIEALLAAQEACPQCTRLIWVADNYASPRDLDLYTKITKPVLIIICGADYRINPRLLTLAKRMQAQVAVTGGFIPRFPALKQGDIFKVRTEEFMWDGSSFKTYVPASQ